MDYRGSGNFSGFLTGSLYYFENSAQGIKKAPSLPEVRALPAKQSKRGVMEVAVSLPEVREIFNKDIAAAPGAACDKPLCCSAGREGSSEK
ncbi:MAG: hypothetical protein C4531_13935 [Desulfurivibrio sp.]|nr:MAG: hypothetical protein C4531_13935 [Desulfurivibrio sp.]